MIKETIKYTDYNGVEREEEFFFNLTKAELMEMELTETGGYAEMVQRIINTQDGPQLVKIFKEFILKSYGEKSADGKSFLKVDEEGRPLSRKFVQTEAYSELFMKLSTDSEAAARFINGVVPKAIAEEAAKQTTNPMLAGA